jgi:hexosaminidase
MAPRHYVYFDYPYSAVPLSKTYSYEPVPEAMNEKEAGHILGPHGCMWTHLSRTESAIDADIFPRMCALAEVAWSRADRRDWGDFRQRMKTHYKRLRAWEVEYGREPEHQAASVPAAE